MEETKSPKGFPIVDSKIPIFLALKEIRDLKPHEQIVETDLKGIVIALRRDPVLRHPIIADSKTGAVLDGTHRLEALKRLECVTIPTALIDYENPLIQIDRWYRTIDGAKLSESARQLQGFSPQEVSLSEADYNLQTRSSYAALRDKNISYSFGSSDTTPLKLFQESYRLEHELRNRPLKIIYTDSDNTEVLSETSFIMSTIRLQKREVIASCEGHYLFPPKSTRHVIPSRPLGIGVPLELLKRTDVKGSETAFEQYLRSKKISHKPEGSKIGSRRYMEEVILFE